LLLDTERAGLETFQQAADSLSLPYDSSLYLGCVGRKRADGLEFLYEQLGKGEQTDTFIETWETMFKAHREVEGIVCKDGAYPLLDFLKTQQIPTVVATSSQREGAHNKLSYTDLNPLLHGVVTSSDVVTGKPHPEIFLKGAQLAGVEPEYCLALEDSDVGVEAALAAGMQVIQVPDLVAPQHNIESNRLGIMPSLHDVLHFIRESCLRQNL